MNTKICSKCQTEKDLNDFPNWKGHKGCICSVCQSIRRKKYRQEHVKNKEKMNKCSNQYKKNNKEKIKEYQKQWRKTNRYKITEYNKNKRYNDINFRIAHNLRSRIKSVLKSKNSLKANKTIKLIGCSIDFLKNYLESKFKSGMTWENYGYSGWHIDHIIPCSSFDLVQQTEQEKCFHYTNMQPLWSWENFSKSDRIEK